MGNLVQITKFKKREIVINNQTVLFQGNNLKISLFNSKFNSQDILWVKTDLFTKIMKFPLIEMDDNYCLLKCDISYSEISNLFNRLFLQNVQILQYFSDLKVYSIKVRYYKKQFIFNSNCYNKDLGTWDDVRITMTNPYDYQIFIENKRFNMTLEENSHGRKVDLSIDYKKSEFKNINCFLKKIVNNDIPLLTHFDGGLKVYLMIDGNKRVVYSWKYKYQAWPFTFIHSNLYSSILFDVNLDGMNKEEYFYSTGTKEYKLLKNEKLGIMIRYDDLWFGDVLTLENFNCHRVCYNPLNGCVRVYGESNLILFHISFSFFMSSHRDNVLKWVFCGTSPLKAISFYEDLKFNFN